MIAGPLGDIPEQNRPMVVFNGMPFRRMVLNASFINLPELGSQHAIDSNEPRKISGEFGVSYNYRIEWIQGHHLKVLWSIRPSSRPVYIVTGAQSGVRIEKLLPRWRWIHA